MSAFQTDPIIAGGRRRGAKEGDGDRRCRPDRDRDHRDEWSDDRDRDQYSLHGEDAYRFTLVNGAVVDLLEYDDGRWRPERIRPNESWTFDGTNLIKIEEERYGYEVSTFTDPDGDSIFVKASEVFQPFAGQPSLSPSPLPAV